MTEFEKIYREYFDDVYCYLRRLSGSEELAEEITSETFFKAMSAIGSFRGECDLRVWLCQIAKNCYFTHQKKSRRLESLEDGALWDLPGEQDSPEERLVRRDEAARVREALHRVGEPYKEVFMWRVLAQLSFRQIGQIFGKSENWACVTYHRAKVMIRSRMEDESCEK